MTLSNGRQIVFVVDCAEIEVRSTNDWGDVFAPPYALPKRNAMIRLIDMASGLQWDEL